MAVKKKAARHKHYTGGKGGNTSELSARLAPLEERNGQHAADDDTIVLDTGSLKLPKALLEEEEKTARLFGLEPVILVILLIALSFIAFIAYLIHQK